MLVDRFFPLSPEERSLELQNLIKEKQLFEYYKVFSNSDFEEKVFCLKNLEEFDSSGEFFEIFTEALRTNLKELVSYLCLSSNYTYNFFDEAQFNQMILKGVFMEIDVTENRQLLKRVNQKLIMMLNDYEEERILAKRIVPTSINKIRSLYENV